MKRIWWLSIIALVGCQAPEQKSIAEHEASSAFFQPATVRPVAAAAVSERLVQVMAPMPAASLARTASLSSLASVTLAWNHSPDTNAVGYRLYYGVASGTYTNSATVGYTDVATLTGLNGGVKYYFAATAYGVNGDESVFSNETSYTTATNTPVTLAISIFMWQLSWQCVPFKTNYIQTSTNLGVWYDIPGRDYYRTNAELITALIPNSTPNSFYRVRIAQ